MSENKQAMTQLQSAFAAFNEASFSLANCYSDLEERIEELNGQLAKAHDERIKQLAEKEILADRLSVLIDALPGGLIVVNALGVIIQCNNKAENILSMPLTGKTWSDITEHCLAKGAIQAGEIELNNGCHINLSMQPLNATGGMIVLFSDVTQHRQLQNSLQHKERLSAMGQMIGELAHQLRTPLASAFLYLSNVKVNSKNNVFNSQLQKLHGCLIGLQNTVDDLLLYARGQNPAFEAVQVTEIASAVKTQFISNTHQHNVSLKVIDNTDNHIAIVNKSALQGAILNLLVNASQAGATLIELVFALNQDSFSISVIDNGPGVSKELQKKIFTPFFTSRSDGTGLGLAVVHTVVDLHGGVIDIESSRTEGACFNIKLPLNEQHNWQMLESSIKQDTKSMLYQQKQGYEYDQMEYFDR